MRLIRDCVTDSRISRQFRTALIVTLIGNIFLAIIKTIAANLSGSSAIFADAINSITDVLYSVLLVVGMWLSQRPPDISHPQGHSRFEPLAALVITLSMAAAGILAARASIMRFIEGGSAITAGWPTLALILSIATKVFLSIFIGRISRKVESPGLAAAAQDNLTDVVTSFAAFLGILGSSLINPLLDPIAGVLVAVWIFRSVWMTAKENLGYLTGAGAGEALRERMLSVVQKIDGVENIHHIVTDYAGPKLVVEMHINVDGEITLNQSHAISDQATAALEALPEVDRAYVHLEPIGQT